MSGDSSSAVGDADTGEGVGLGGSPVEEGKPAAAQANLPRTALEEVLRPLAIAGMLTCIAVSLTQLIMTFAPAWPGTVFCVTAFAISLESIHSYRLLSRMRPSQKDSLRFRFVEWVVILLIVRFGPYAFYGSGRLAQDVASWQTDLATFFDGGFIVSCLFIVLFWSLALTLARTMHELEASPAERMPSVTDPRHYLHSTMPHHGLTDRRARISRIVTIFFWGGAALLILTGFSRVDVRDLITLQHSRSSGVILNVLAYFVIGLLLISQAQYTNLRANWELQSIPVLGHLGRRWLLLVILFLTIVALVAIVLPVSYSVGLIAALSAVLQWVVYIILQVVFVIFFIVASVIGFLFSWLPAKQGGPEAPTRPQPTPPPPPAVVAQAGSPWWQVLRSLLFWGILTAVVGYSLYRFAADRWGLFRGLSATSLAKWLRKLWRSLRLGARRAAARLREQMSRRLAARQAKAKARSWRYLSLRRLSPRERVRYYYLSVLHRSAQLGIGRQPSKTPLEYEKVFEGNVPEAAPQTEALTRAFIEARYSEHDVTPEHASATQSAWRGVKRALTMRRRAKATGQPDSPPGADQKGT